MQKENLSAEVALPLKISKDTMRTAKNQAELNLANDAKEMGDCFSK